MVFSDGFAEQFWVFDDVADIMTDFAIHIEKHSLRGLEGCTANPHTKKELANFAHAQKHCLWHYHIGIPQYLGDEGDKTSECALHHQRFDDKIVLLELSAHSPFKMPIVEN